MSNVQSVSVTVRPTKTNCRYWAKLVHADTVLPLPSFVSEAKDIPGSYLQLGEEELGLGDFLIEGQQVHPRKPRGWTYRICYMAIDGSLQRVTPSMEHKQAMKGSGMCLEWLKGAGQLAACVRLIHGLRMGMNADALPIETPEGPVSMEDYLRVARLRDVWFEQTEDETEPSPRRVYEQALALARMPRLPEGCEELELTPSEESIFA